LQLKGYLMRLLLLAGAVLLAAPAYAQVPPLPVAEAKAPPTAAPEAKAPPTAMLVPGNCVYNYADHFKCGLGVHPHDPPQFRKDVLPGSYIDEDGRVFPPAAHDRFWGEENSPARPVASAPASLPLPTSALKSAQR
jgi:hypothetical protein